MKNYFVFVVDTEINLGDIYIEMCSFVTGKPPRTRFADEYVSRFGKPLDFVIDQPGFPCCCKLLPTPKRFNNGTGLYFWDGEESEASAHYREHCSEKSKSEVHLSLIGEKWRKAWEDRRNWQMPMHPAFGSLGIFMSRGTSPEETSRLTELATEFADLHKVQVLNFRLIQIRTITEEVWRNFGNDRQTDFSGFEI